jgi:DNA-binding transcriptional ArsR family regulator
MSRNVAASTRKGAPVFAALGDETRMRILAKLSASGPLSITQITETEDVTRQAITKHLTVLSGAGLVRDLRRGRERLWELDLAPLDDARSYLNILSERWDQRLARLKALVENTP